MKYKIIEDGIYTYSVRFCSIKAAKKAIVRWNLFDEQNYIERPDETHKIIDETQNN
jgi:hypothetical protein